MSYDTHDTSEVMQAPTPDLHVPAIPVVVDGIVLTDELPTECTYKRVVLSAGSSAQKILEKDDRRKSAILWFPATGAGADCVCLGSSSGQAQAFTGALLTSLNATTRFEITDRNTVWARPGDIQQAGAAFTGVIPATSDVILSIIEQHWSR